MEYSTPTVGSDYCLQRKPARAKARRAFRFQHRRPVRSGSSPDRVWINAPSRAKTLHPPRVHGACSRRLRAMRTAPTSCVGEACGYAEAHHRAALAARTKAAICRATALRHVPRAWCRASGDRAGPHCANRGGRPRRAREHAGAVQRMQPGEGAVRSCAGARAVDATRGRRATALSVGSRARAIYGGGLKGWGARRGNRRPKVFSAPAGFGWGGIKWVNADQRRSRLSFACSRETAAIVR